MNINTKIIDLQKQAQRTYIVVKVESGVPVLVKSYRNKQSAKKHEQFLRKHMHPENDETGIFKIQV